jgi:hypothetical protein
VNTDVFAILLVALVTLAVTTGTVMALLVSRSKKQLRPRISNAFQLPPSNLCSIQGQFQTALNRPTSWVAIKSHNLGAVQTALGLHHVKPCTWLDGLAGEEKLFIAPPTKGWILLFGTGLPDPSHDVDSCFRFIVKLSKTFGTVQFFSANRALFHHAWVRADGGKIARAYAWAGSTLWNQGPFTPAESDLDLHCFDYCAPDEAPPAYLCSETMSANVDKVPLLAARWSLDPAGIDQRVLSKQFGLAGEPSRAY